MRRSVAVSMFVLLAGLTAGCVPVLLPVPDVPPVEDDCGASQLQGLIGQPVGILAGMTFTGTVRILRPGDVVTMEFGPNRLNFAVDARDRITRITCG